MVILFMKPACLIHVDLLLIGVKVYAIKNLFNILCRRVYNNCSNMNCSDDSKWPPCTGYMLVLWPY
jgi:hypothetical protein